MRRNILLVGLMQVTSLLHSWQATVCYHCSNLVTTAGLFPFNSWKIDLQYKSTFWSARYRSDCACAQCLNCTKQNSRKNNELTMLVPHSEHTFYPSLETLLLLFCAFAVHFCICLCFVYCHVFFCCAHSITLCFSLLFWFHCPQLNCFHFQTWFPAYKNSD